MTNKNTISDIINETRKIEDNNHTNIHFYSKITYLIDSNNLGQTLDKNLEDKIKLLNRQMNDINHLTSEILNDLSKRHN